MNTRRTLLSLVLSAFAGGFAAAQTALPEENLTSDQVTQLLKEEWIFLHERIDEFIKKTETRDEFETQPEFDIRTGRERKAFNDQVAAHVQDKKIDKRTFSTYFHVNFLRYHLEGGYFALAVPSSIEAPYDIPQLVTSVAPNPHVGLADTTERGFRTSKLYLKFKPEFHWNTNRDIARNARTDSTNVVFRLRFTIALGQNSSAKQAVLRILPKEVALMNTLRKTVYWKEDIR